MRQRIEPFLDLLDARYLPLLFAYTPQAYTVYAWQLASGAPETIAQLAGIGFEFISVGAIAWSERGAGWQAARWPSITALLFSVAVAVGHYGSREGALAVLHAGFPLVAYFYTLMIHTRRTVNPPILPATESRHTDVTIVNTVQTALVTPPDKRQQARALVDDGVTLTEAARQVGVSRQTLSKWMSVKEAT